MLGKSKNCVKIIFLTTAITGCQKGEKTIDNLNNELIEQKKEISVLKTKINEVGKVENKISIIEASINEKIELYVNESKKLKEQLKFVNLEIQGIKNNQNQAINKNDNKNMKVDNINRKAERYSLELTYPLPGTFGKQLDQLLIEVKNNISVLEERVRVAQAQLALGSATAGNIVRSRSMDFSTTLESDRDVAAALSGMLHSAGNDLGSLRAALQNAKSIYIALQRQAKLIEGNGIVKAKQSIVDCEEKIKEYKSANLNPTVPNLSLTKGRITFQSVANREEAISVVKKDVVLLNRYIEKIENFDRANEVNK